MAELVCVATFDNTGSAETALEKLRSASLEAVLETTEGGGMTPDTSGADVRVMVRAGNLEQARQLLGAA